MKQPAVINGMNASWASTLSAADANGVQEYGGVVMLGTYADAFGYFYIPKQGVKISYETWLNGVPATIDLPFEDIDRGPVNGGIYCVMIFHTHPPLSEYTGEKEERPTGMSQKDLEQTKIPSVVKDYSASVHSSKDDKNSSTTYSNNGIERRIIE